MSVLMSSLASVNGLIVTNCGLIVTVGGSMFVLISGVWGLQSALSSTHISVLIVSLPVCVAMAS